LEPPKLIPHKLILNSIQSPQLTNGGEKCRGIKSGQHLGKPKSSLDNKSSEKTANSRYALLFPLSVLVTLKEVRKEFATKKAKKKKVQRK